MKGYGHEIDEQVHAMRDYSDAGYIAEVKVINAAKDRIKERQDNQQRDGITPPKVRRIPNSEHYEFVPADDND